jgi:hypothetical protein
VHFIPHDRKVYIGWCHPGSWRDDLRVRVVVS